MGDLDLSELIDPRFNQERRVADARREREANTHCYAAADTWPYLSDTLIIGFGHKARHGKDTAAQAILDQYGQLGVRRYAFSLGFKAVARAMFGMTTKDPQLLQVLGTDVFRRKDPDVWIRTLHFTIHEDAPKVALITDVRFPNEAEWIRSQGGIVIKVERIDENGLSYLSGDRNPLHESETALDHYSSWNYTIRTDRVELLREAAKAIFVGDYNERYNEA